MVLTDIPVVSIPGTVFAAGSPDGDCELASHYSPRVTP